MVHTITEYQPLKPKFDKIFDSDSLINGYVITLFALYLLCHRLEWLTGFHFISNLLGVIIIDNSVECNCDHFR